MALSQSKLFNPSPDDPHFVVPNPSFFLLDLAGASHFIDPIDSKKRTKIIGTMRTYGILSAS